MCKGETNLILAARVTDNVIMSTAEITVVMTISTTITHMWIVIIIAKALKLMTRCVFLH